MANHQPVVTVYSSGAHGMVPIEAGDQIEWKRDGYVGSFMAAVEHVWRNDSGKVRVKIRLLSQNGRAFTPGGVRARTIQHGILQVFDKDGNPRGQLHGS